MSAHEFHDDPLDADQAAAILRCEPVTAEDLMRSGELPATKIGRSWVTLRSYVIEFLRRRIEQEKPAPTTTPARIVRPKRRSPPPLPVIDGSGSPDPTRAGSRNAASSAGRPTP